MDTFQFQPDWGMQRSHKPDLKLLRFGDGYEQAAPKGLNHNLRTYSVTFTGSKARLDQIIAFLEKQGGYKAFLWTPYGGKQGKFRANEWNITYQTGFMTLSTEFREVIA